MVPAPPRIGRRKYDKKEYRRSFQVGGATDGNVEEKVLRLPDGNIVVVGEEATAAPELLFKPELVKKNYSGVNAIKTYFLTKRPLSMGGCKPTNLTSSNIRTDICKSH